VGSDGVFDMWGDLFGFGELLCADLVVELCDFLLSIVNFYVDMLILWIVQCGKL